MEEMSEAATAHKDLTNKREMEEMSEAATAHKELTNKREMEEMREAAMAYYANMTKEQQSMARNFYKALDIDGDEKVSLQEFIDFLEEEGFMENVPQNLFSMLDKNDNGTLDFEECITLYYMISGKRLIICAGCRTYLWGIHFVCVNCYDAGSPTFDLCCSCYRNKKFQHHHSAFLDNFALLRYRQPLSSSSQEPDAIPDQENTSEQGRAEEARSKQRNTSKRGQARRKNQRMEKMRKNLEELQLGETVGQAVGQTVGRTIGQIGQALVDYVCRIM